MAVQQISVTRALVELKRYQARIEKTITESVFVGVSIGRDSTRKVYGNTSHSVDSTERAIVGNLARVEQLILNRQKLKSAIVLSNATVRVNVMGIDMTVAEAIELKSQQSTLQLLADTIRSQRAAAVTTVDQLNTRLESNIDHLLSTIYGNDKTKVSGIDYVEVATPQKRAKEANLIDPIVSDQKIISVEELASKLECELDFVLSEINAKTLITVDL